MTAGNDGTPENDDPFAYLYRSEGGEPQDPAAGQPRPGGPPQPRTSYHQVQRVGERRSPQQSPAGGGYGYPPPQYQQPPTGGYGYPPQDTGRPHGQQPHDPPGGGRRAAGHGEGPGMPNRKGLLIGAIAVVAAVAIGIAFAMTNSSGDKKTGADGKPTTPPVSTAPPTTQPTSAPAPTQFSSQKTAAATLALSGGAKQSTQWPGSNAGTYVDGMGTPGASAQWTVTVPQDGSYTFFISYGNAGADAKLGLTVNGTPRTDQVNMKNYGSYTDWSKAWNNTTFAWVNLKKGANTLLLSCTPGVNCGVNLDQVWLKQGQVRN